MPTPQLLPTNFDELVEQAVEVFWRSRLNNAVTTQGGSRGAVIGGKNMDGFLQLVEIIAEHVGLPRECVQHQGHNAVTLPGFFRATKKWDALIFHEDRLVAALEFKSQIGSLGNNQNNRSEEAIGNAVDFLRAHEESGFQNENLFEGDPRPPFLGYLMLCEDSGDARSGVRVIESNFDVFDEFKDASYADRYKILCERLMRENLYDAASLILTPKDQGVTGEWGQMSQPTGVRNFYSSLSAHLLNVVSRD